MTSTEEHCVLRYNQRAKNFSEEALFLHVVSLRFVFTDSSDEDIMGEQTESGVRLAKCAFQTVLCFFFFLAIVANSGLRLCLQDEWDEEESSSEMEVGGEQEESEQSGEEEENMQQDSDSDTQT